MLSDVVVKDPTSAASRKDANKPSAAAKSRSREDTAIVKARHNSMTVEAEKRSELQNNNREHSPSHLEKHSGSIPSLQEEYIIKDIEKVLHNKLKSGSYVLELDEKLSDEHQAKKQIPATTRNEKSKGLVD